MYTVCYLFLPWLLVLCILFTQLSHIKACGTSTHISIAHEAVTFFKGPDSEQINYAELLGKHQDAFVAGNPYPDAMYPSLCFGGKYHESAEDTHWAPFLNATIQYVRENFPKPWDEVSPLLTRDCSIDEISLHSSRRGERQLN